MSTVEFCGENFTLADKVGLMPMMKLAVLARSGADANDMDALVAMYDLVRQIVTDEDLARFEEVATVNRVDGDGLNEFIGRAMVVLANRPTVRSSDSPDGPQITEPNSTAVSSSPGTVRTPDDVIEMFNAQGRPDKALLVRRRQESLTG